jgi:hypothetical protein
VEGAPGIKDAVLMGRLFAEVDAARQATRRITAGSDTDGRREGPDR